MKAFTLLQSTCTWNHLVVNTFTRSYGATAAAAKQPSPAVRYLLDLHKLDPNVIQGTGPKSRLLKGDVLKYLENLKSGKVTAPAAPKVAKAAPIPVQKGTFAEVAVSADQKAFSEVTVRSKNAMPHLYLTVHCTLSPHLQQLAKQTGVTLREIVVKGAVSSLNQLLASSRNNASRNAATIRVGIAVNEDDGEKWVVLPDADRLDMLSVAEIIKNGPKSAVPPQDATFGVRDLNGAVSKVGAKFIEEAGSVITVGQWMITIGAQSTKVVWDEKGKKPATAVSVPITLSCNNGLLDDYVAAQMLQSIKNYLAEPFL